MSVKNLFSKLPEKICVTITHEDGKYFIELPELHIFTESDSKEEIDYYLNDLIYCHFDVPKKYQNEVRYCKKQERATDLTKVDVSQFRMFITPTFSSSCRA